MLGRIILLAAFATAAIAATKSFVLGFLQSQGSGLHMAAVWAARLLFAPPAVLLGMVAPFAVRLKPADARTGGRTAGRISSGMNGFLKYAIVSFWRALMAACSRCIWLRFVQVPREIGRFYTGGDSRVPNGLVMTRAQKVRL